jgi:hypothetical protein
VSNPLNSDELRAKLNGETGRLSWSELQRHFARGAVLAVAAELDLVEVAARIAEDDQVAVKGWMDAGRLVRATDSHARVWAAVSDEPALWAVVVAPWVLVQHARLH